MPNEFDLLHQNQPAHEADSNDVAQKPGKHANTDFVGSGQMGPLPPVPGKRAATEALPFDLVVRARESQGQQLPSDVQQKIEHSIGTSLSNVTVHTGPASAAANKALGARAYVDGQQIHFDEGEYDPSSARGIQLIAHEAAHTVQSRGATPAKAVSDPSDHVEREADEVAKNVMLGMRSTALSNSQTSAVMRKKKDEKDAPVADASQQNKPPQKAGKEDLQTDASGKKKETAPAGAKNTQSVAPKADDPDLAAAGGKGDKAAVQAKPGANAKDAKGKGAKGAHDVAPKGDKKADPQSVDAGGKDHHTGDLYTKKPAPVVDHAVVPQVPAITAPTLDIPKVSKQQTEKWVKETGRTPEQHHDQIMAALGQLTTEVQSAQNELMAQSDALQQKVTKDVNDRVQNFTSSVTAPGRARVFAAYAGMNKTVDDSATGALTQVATHKTAGKAQIATQLPTKKTELQKKLEAAKGVVKATIDKNVPAAIAGIQQFAGQIPGLIEDHKAKALETAKTAGQAYPPSAGNADAGLASAELSLKNDVWQKQLVGYGKSIGKDYEKKLKPLSEDIKGSAEAMVRSAIADMANELENVLAMYEKGSGEKLDKTAKDSEAKLDVQETTAKKSITDAKTSSQKKIDSERTAALDAADKAGKDLGEGATAAGTELVNKIKTKAATDAQAYAKITGDLQGFLKKGGPKKFEDVNPRIADARQQLSKLHETNKQSLDALATNGTADLVQTLNKQKTDYDAAIKDREDAAKKTEAEIRKDVAKGATDMGTSISTAANGVTETVTTETAKIDAALAGFHQTTDAALKDFSGKVVEAIQLKITEAHKAFEDANVAEKFVKKVEPNIDKEVEAKKKSLGKDASTLRDAMDGWGTDENKIYGVLRKCSYGEIEYLEAVYDDHYRWRAKDGKRPLRYDFGDEMSGNELAIAMAYLDHHRNEAIKLELKDSCHWYNDDEDRIEQVLRSCNDDEIKHLNTDAEANKVLLDTRSHLSGCDADVLDALVDTKMKQEDRAIKADAIRVFDAMKGPGTDEAKMKQILEGTTDEEARKKLRQQFNTYAASKGWEQGTGTVDAQGNVDDALTRAIKDDTSDGEQAVMLAFAAEKRDENLVKAAKLYQAADGVGTDEAQMFEALDDEQYAAAWEKASPEERKALEEARKAQIDKNLTKLDANYKSADSLIEGETQKAPWTWGEILAGKKEDGTAIDSGSIKKMMMYDGPYSPYLEYLVAQRKLQTGRAEPDLLLAYAFWNTPGTDEDTVMKVLGNGGEPKPRAELWGPSGIVAKFKNTWGVALHDTDELAKMDPAMKSPDGELSSELGGKDWMKVRILMCGQPENAQQMDYIAQLRHKQATSGVIGGGFMWVAEKVGATDARTTEAKQMERWDDTYKKDFVEKGIEKKNFADIDPKDSKTLQSVEQLKRLSEYVEQDTDAYEATVSAIVDAVVTAIEVIGGVIVSFATMGAASPMLAAFLANMIIQGTMIVLKAAVLGDQYGWGDFGADAIKAIGTSGFAALGQAKSLQGLTEHIGEYVASKIFIAAEQGVQQGGGQLVQQGGKWGIKMTQESIDKISKRIAQGSMNVITSSGQEVYNTLTNEKTYEGKLGDVLWGENSLGRRLLTNFPKAFAEGFVKQWIDEIAGTSNLDNNGKLRTARQNALANMLSDLGGQTAGFFVYVDNYGDAGHFWEEFFKMEARTAFSGFASGYAMHKGRARHMGRDFIEKPEFSGDTLNEHWDILEPRERQTLAEFVMKYGDEAAKAKLPDRYKALVNMKAKAGQTGGETTSSTTTTTTSTTTTTTKPATTGDDKSGTAIVTKPEENAKKQQPEHQQQNEAEEAKKAAAKAKADQEAAQQKQQAKTDEAQQQENEQQAQKQKDAAEKAESSKSQKKPGTEEETEAQAKKLKEREEQDARIKKIIDEEMGEEADEDFVVDPDPEAQARRKVRDKKQAEKDEQAGFEDAREDREQRKADKRAKKDAKKAAKKEQERLTDLATEAFNKYGGQIEDAKQLLREIAGDLGEVSGRAKEPESAANRLERAKAFTKKPIVTVDDAIDNLWDALGTRVVLKSTKPEDIAKVMQALTKAIQEGKIEVVKAASNHGEGVAPVLTQSDLDTINAAAGGKADTVNGVKTAGGDKSAFTAGLLFVRYPNGTRGEIQLIGKAALEVANIEHIPYDLSIGKPIARGVEGPHLQEMQDTLAPVEAAYKALANDPVKKAAYEQYMRDLYKYATEVDRGNTEATPPKLPEGIDHHLSKESLDATVRKLEDIKKQAKTEKTAQEKAQQEEASKNKPATTKPEEGDGAIKAGPSTKKQTEAGASWSEDELQTKKPAPESEEEALARRSQGVKPSAKADPEKWAEPTKRNGVPETTPLSRQEIRDFIEAKYAKTVEALKKNAPAANPEYQHFIDEMKKVQKIPDEDTRKAESKKLFKEFLKKSNEIEAKTGSSEGETVRSLYNIVEKDDFVAWKETIAHLSKEQQAKLSSMWREETKILARDLMSDQLAKEFLYERDLADYGDRRGPRFEKLFENNKDGGKKTDDEAYDGIMDSSGRSNKDANAAKTGSAKGEESAIAKQIREGAVDPTDKLAQLKEERANKPTKAGPEKEDATAKKQTEKDDPTAKKEEVDPKKQVSPEDQLKEQQAKKTPVEADATVAETQKVVRAAKTPEEQKDAATLQKSMDVLENELGTGIQKKLTPPPADKPVLSQSPSDALIGLPTDAIEPTAKADQALAAFKEKGIPRWPGLTENERAHETKFANNVEQNLEQFVNEFYARSQKGDMFEFEVDGAKKLYAAYGAGREVKDITPEQLQVRATANHALHPTAVAIARLAFLKRLDQMQPGEQVFVTNGGCGGGKGSLTGLAKQALPGSKFGAVWDAAGEGDATENMWVLKAAQARGLKVTYGFVENDPMKNYEGVLKRADSTGRIVDPITYARSYVRGQQNMKEFLASKEYQDALAADPTSVQAIGINFRQKMADKDNPDAGLLGNKGLITAKDIPDAPDEATVTESAIKDFKKWHDAKVAAGDKNADLWMEGAGTNALKFKPGQQLEEEPQVAKAGKEQSEQGPVKDTKADPKQTLDNGEPTRVTFTSKGDKLAEAAKKIPPESGYFDLVVHGDANSFYLFHNGEWVPVKANTVRQYLLRQPGYDGQPIRLISCEAGANANGIAQSISNGLGVKVKAPTDTVWVHPDGHMTIGPSSKENTGAWADFEPGNHNGTKVAGGTKTGGAKTEGGDDGAVSAGKPKEPADEWYEHLRKGLTSDELAKLDDQTKGMAPKDVMDKFGGSVAAARKAVGAPKDVKITGATTVEMFMNPPLPPDGRERWAYQEIKENWSSDRQKLHRKLLDEAKAAALGLAEATASASDGPTLFAMRGNTAAGKTRAVGTSVPELATAMNKKELRNGPVNPDHFKQALIDATGGTLTSTHVHSESSTMSTWLEEELKGATLSDGKTKANIVIDKRLASKGEVDTYAQMAKTTDRKFVLYDVDAPLETSLAGVLDRQPGEGNPLPPFDIVRKGFDSVRNNRAAVMEMFLNDPSLGTYVLFGTLPTGERVEIASVVNGKQTVKNPDMLKQALHPGSDGDRLAATQITAAGIEAMTAQLPTGYAAKVKGVLTRYIGWTWEAALDAHSMEQPAPKKPDPA